MDDSFFSETAYASKEDSRARLHAAKPAPVHINSSDLGGEIGEGLEVDKEKVSQEGNNEPDGPTKLPVEQPKAEPVNEDKEAEAESSISQTNYDFFEYYNPNAGLKIPGDVVAYIGHRDPDRDRSGTASEDVSLPMTDKSRLLAGLAARSQQLNESASRSRSEKEMTELDASPRDRHQAHSAAQAKSPPADSTMLPSHKSGDEQTDDTKMTADPSRRQL